MPYAPGITARAGDYFASVGPQIAQNIQNWQANRRDREQSITTAAMLARYLQNDPQGMQLFGEELGNVPSMSASQAKGVIGGLTMYLNQRHLNAAEEAQKTATDIAQKQLTITQADAAAREAERVRQAAFNRAIAQRANPPLMFSSAAGQQQPGTAAALDPDYINQAAIESGIYGQPEHINMLNAATTYATRNRGLALGEERVTSGGTKITGLGLGVPPHVEPGKGGLAAGQTMTTPGGLTITGLGEAFPPHVSQDIGLPLGREEITSSGATLTGMGPGQPVHISPPEKLSPMDQGIVQFTPVFAHQLDAAKAAVDKYGAGWTLNPVARATLSQLPTLLATSFAKVTDPGGVVRESDIITFEKKLFPQGRWTRPEVTQAAIVNLRKELVEQVRTWSANHGGKMPANMPQWMHDQVGTGTGTGAAAGAGGGYDTAEAVRKAYQEGKLTRDQAAQILIQKKFAQ